MSYSAHGEGGRFVAISKNMNIILYHHAVVIVSDNDSTSILIRGYESK